MKTKNVLERENIMKYYYEEKENLEMEDLGTNSPKVQFKDFTIIKNTPAFIRNISWAVRKIKDGTLTVGIYKDNSFCPQHWRVPLTYAPYPIADRDKAKERLGIIAATLNKNKVYLLTNYKSIALLLNFENNPQCYIMPYDSPIRLDWYWFAFDSLLKANMVEPYAKPTNDTEARILAKYCAEDKEHFEKYVELRDGKINFREYNEDSELNSSNVSGEDIF